MPASSKTRTTHLNVSLPHDNKRLPWFHFPLVCKYFRSIKEHAEKLKNPPKNSKGQPIKFSPGMLVFYVASQEQRYQEYEEASTADKKMQKRYCTRYNHDSGLKECKDGEKCKYFHGCYMCDSTTHAATEYYFYEKQKVFVCPSRQQFEEEYYRLTSFYDMQEDDLYYLWLTKPDAESQPPTTVPGDTTSLKKRKNKKQKKQKKIPSPSPSPPSPVLQEQASPSLLDAIKALQKHNKRLAKTAAKATEVISSPLPTTEVISSPRPPTLTTARRSSVVHLVTPSPSTDGICKSPPLPETPEYPEEDVRELDQVMHEILTAQLPPASSPSVYRLKKNGLDIEFENGRVTIGGLGQELSLAWDGVELSTIPRSVTQGIQTLTITISYISQ